jgi:hypothetical protein
MESIFESKKPTEPAQGMESRKTWSPSKRILLYLQEYNARRENIGQVKQIPGFSSDVF